MMIYKNAGRQIQILRIKNGLAQEQLADHINSSQKYISEVENGIKRPSILFYIKIANFFRVSLDWIFRTDIKFVDSMFTDTMAVRMKYLDKEDQEHIVDYINLFEHYLEKQKE